MLIPAFFVYLNYFQPLGIFLFRSFYALICQIIPGQFLPGKIFFLPDVLILFLGRKPAADVPLLFVFLQHLFDLFIQLGTDLFEPLGHIFMYCCTKLVRYHPSPFLWQDEGKFVSFLLCLPRSFQLYVSILHLSYFGLM